MEKLELAQLDCFKQIQKLGTNYRKTPKDRLTSGYVEIRLEMLESYWHDYQTNHKALLAASLEERENIKYFVNEEYDACLSHYFEIKTKMRDTLKTMQSSVRSDPQLECNNQPSVSTKLPAIQIPTFSGNYRDWLSFHDIFKSLVHDNNNISKVNKCHYLKTSLRGDAENLVKMIQVSESSYDIMWEMLKKRYNNKRSIVNTYIGKMLNQRKITTESAKSIRELLDVTTECLATLKGLQLPTDHWDDLVVFIIIQKLDTESHKLFEQKLESISKLPTWKELAEFLEHRFHTLESVKSRQEPSHPQPVKHTSKSFATELTHTHTKCNYCNGDHLIFRCKDFLSLDLQAKKDFVQANQICFNCMKKGHPVKSCLQSTTCKRCGRKHHTLLHGFTQPNSSKDNNHTANSKETNTSPVMNSTVEISSNNTLENSSYSPSSVILATALVRVTSEKLGRACVLRALIDQGSQASLITENACQVLGLKREAIKGNVSGVGSVKTITKAKVEFEISSRNESQDSQVKIKVTAFVMRSLTSYLPQQTHAVDWPQLRGLQLADPTFHNPGKIDLLLGADVFPEIIQNGILTHKSDSHNLVAQQTKLGWLISGQNTASSNHVEVSVHHLKVDTDSLLRRFWEIEEPQEKRILTNLELECEKHYKATHQRLDNGRYVVRLPFLSTPPDIGESFTMAQKRFTALANKLRRDTNMETKYNEFMDDYIQQNHMELIPDDEIDKEQNNVCYIPHHAVINNEHLTTKLRVVFDSSANTSNGKSINDSLMCGPALQNDIRDVTLRWRKHKVVLIADIRQHYRQISLDPKDRDYLRILWRPQRGEQQPIQHFRLTTVTYGTSCAPYQAIRTLKQLAEDEKENFEDDITDTLLKIFFVDDLLGGRGSSLDTANLKQKITELLKKGGFLLHKWASNVSDIEGAEQCNRKILGVNWNGFTDKFELQITLPLPTDIITKRTVLRDIATIYDPAGWLAPVVVVAKHILQTLWIDKIEWDQPLPDSILQDWITYRRELVDMPIITVERWLGIDDNTVEIELHGFSDASMMAYSAVVYCRVLKQNEVTTTIIEAKTKVAPVKQISLPRLELCGAVLLAKLLHRVQTALSISKRNVYAWTDATIVLAWLQKPPSYWTTFIANRVTEITNLIEKERWFHVVSEDNPADVASRGISPLELPSHQLWWGGPTWLREASPLPLDRSIIEHTNLEKKSVCDVSVNSVVCQELNSESDLSQVLLSRYSNLTKLVRVMCRMLRFINCIKHKLKTKLKLTYPKWLTTSELDISYKTLLFLSQYKSFKEEIKIIKNTDINKIKCLNKLENGKKIAKLNPYLDENNLLRVGGRLHYSSLHSEMKHPYILIRDKLSDLIVQDAHYKTLHGGVQLILNYIRRKFHIIGVKYIAKAVVHKCITCVKNAAKLRSQQMGNLPRDRVNPQRPFSVTGVDFAGPVILKLFSGRGSNRNQKAYIAVFICTAVKAIHLELVTSLSSEGFIAAFRRFTSRRGHCNKLISDCGTNFIGASKELKQMFVDSKTDLPVEIADLLARDGTDWQFNPAGAPHMGGLWESAVKSVKFHLNRVLNDTKLTYEEYSTLLCQIESCLNSRPLTPIDANTDDSLDVLTPSHFLIGETMLAVPEQDLTHVNVPYTYRWSYIQKKLQSFWHKWSHDYLVGLNQRQKWTGIQPNINIGTIVLVKDDKLPATKWLLARVTDTHAGSDGLIRVVTLKCKNCIIKRPIHKLCVLPVGNV